MSKLPQDAFELYMSLGDGRSYQAVADHYGVNKRSVTKRARQEDWQGRLERLERQAQASVDERAVESIESVKSRHLKMVKLIQGKAIEALRSLPLDSAMDAVRALDLSLKQERLIRGEPTDRTAVSVEDVIRQEYERWIGTAEDDEDGGEVR